MDTNHGPERARRWQRWLSAWTLLSAPCLCVATLMWGIGAVIVITGVSGLMFVLCTLAYQSATQDPAVVEKASQPRALALRALAGGSIGAAVVVIASISGPAAFLWFIAAALSTPPVIERAGLARTRHETVSPPTEDVVQDAPLLVVLLAQPADEMSDPQLCRAWRRSYLALQDAHTAAEMAKVVALRQAYLDEIESRNSVALAAWLASGARAAGGPDRFMDPGPQGRTDAA